MPELMLKSRVGWALPTEISFTKIRIGCLTHFIPTPIRWIIPIFHTPVKRWIRPISDAFYQSVLHRIKMDIIHVPPKIILITNHVFPKTPLPYRCFTVFPFWIGHPFVTVKQVFSPFWKSCLNHTPAFGIIAVVFRKSPYTMDMVRKQHPSANRKWT